MTQSENKSLENTINNKSSLELFNVDDSDKVDKSRYINLPEEIVTQHLNKAIYKKSDKEDILKEFIFLYKTNSSTTEIPTKNYEILFDPNKHSDNNETVKKFIEQFDNKEDINLKFARKGKHRIEGIPAEFRRIGNWMQFTAKEEPYIKVELVLNYLI
jgi:hypothetical protein